MLTEENKVIARRLRQTTRAVKANPLSLLLILVLLSSYIFGASSAKASPLFGNGNHPISWNPDRLELEVMQGPECLDVM